MFVKIGLVHRSEETRGLDIIFNLADTEGRRQLLRLASQLKVEIVFHHYEIAEYGFILLLLDLLRVQYTASATFMKMQIQVTIPTGEKTIYQPTADRESGYQSPPL